MDSKALYFYVPSVKRRGRGVVARGGAHFGKPQHDVLHPVGDICIGFWVVRFQGSGFRVQGSGFRVQGSKFRAQGSGFRVQGSGFRVQGLGFTGDGEGVERLHPDGLVCG
jgi:hypothetical protein